MEEHLDRDSLLYFSVQFFYDGLNSITAEIGMEAGEVQGGYVKAAIKFAYLGERTRRAAQSYYDTWLVFSPPQTWDADPAVKQVASRLHSLLDRFRNAVLPRLTQARALPEDADGEQRAGDVIKECLPRVKGIRAELASILDMPVFAAPAPLPCQIHLPDQRIRHGSVEVALVELDVKGYSEMAHVMHGYLSREHDAVRGLFWLNSRIARFIQRALDASGADGQSFLLSTGDGAFLAFANVDESPHSSVDQAHRFAEQLQAQTLHYNCHRETETVQFHFRIGVAFGRITVRPHLTSDHRLLGYATGGVPFIHAVRLEAACPPDCVLLTGPAYEQLSNGFRAHYTGPTAKRGKGPEQLDAYVWAPIRTPPAA